MNELMILINIYCDNLCVLLAAIYTEQQLWPDLISSSYSLLHIETDTQTNTHTHKSVIEMMKFPIEFLVFGVMKISSRSTDQKKMRAKSDF